MASEHLFWLAGKRAAGTLADVRNPVNGEVIARVHQASARQVEEAIAAAAEAFKTLRGWSSYKRQEACALVHKRLGERAEEFARTIALEAGKPIRAARGEVARALTTFRLAAEEATRIGGEQLPVDIDARSEGYHAVVERVPIGPCTFITGFNFPLNLAVHKVAPALAAGCPFVLKPAPRTPLTALLLGDILAETGLPAGAWSVLPAENRDVAALISDERIKLISFTGSVSVGWKIKEIAGKKPVVLELGSDSPVIVEADADLADAVPRIVTGAFSYAGQSCISVQRIYLQRGIAERASAMLVERTRDLKVGDPLEEATDVGPLIDEDNAKRVEAWVNEAVAAGAQLLTGGQRRGSYYMPTLVAGVPRHLKLACEEVFGPVAVVERYDAFDEALALANGPNYGLQAGVFTRDLFKARRAFEMLEMGGVVINDVPTTRIDAMPYGGVKNSGMGREGVKYAIEHLTERKVMVTRYR